MSAGRVQSWWRAFVPQGDGFLALLHIGVVAMVVALIVKEAHGG